VGTQEELLGRILDAAVHIKQREDQLRQQHAIFAHELHSALRLAVGFSNIHFEL
jgi:hypothetical protein